MEDHNNDHIISGICIAMETNMKIDEVQQGKPCV